MADFGTALTWTTFLVTFVIVVPNIFTIKTFGDSGYLSEAVYNNLLDRIERRPFGNLMLQSSFILFLLGIARNLALWITWFLYLSQGANVDTPPSTTLRTLFILNNAFIFAGTVAHHLSESTFWQLGWFGVSLFLRIIEFILFLAAAILVTIEYSSLADTGADRGEELGLLIVLWIIVGLTLLIWIVRSWLFYAEADDNDGTDAVLIPSAAKGATQQQQQQAMANNPAYMRAAASMYAQQQQQFRKP